MYLRTKFQISSIILTHFRQDGGVAGGEGGGVILPSLYLNNSKPTPKEPTQIRVNCPIFFWVSSDSKNRIIDWFVIN